MASVTQPKVILFDIGGVVVSARYLSAPSSPVSPHKMNPNEVDYMRFPEK